MATDPKQRLTVQDYLILERRAETKSDYLDGETFAMTGASRKHNLISMNVAASLPAQLAGSPREIYARDMREWTPTDLLTYPDVVAVCGEPRFNEGQFDTLLNRSWSSRSSLPPPRPTTVSPSSTTAGRSPPSLRWSSPPRTAP